MQNTFCMIKFYANIIFLVIPFLKIILFTHTVLDLQGRVGFFSGCTERGRLSGSGAQVPHRVGFSRCGAQAPGCAGFSSCGADSVVAAPRPQGTGSAMAVHGLTCSAGGGIFLGQA